MISGPGPRLYTSRVGRSRPPQRYLCNAISARYSTSVRDKPRERVVDTVFVRTASLWTVSSTRPKNMHDFSAVRGVENHSKSVSAVWV